MSPWVRCVLCASVVAALSLGGAAAHGRAPAPVGSSAGADSQAPQWVELAYGEDPRQRLDLYRAPSTAPRPLVVLVHGGSWVSGDKKNFRAQAPRFVPWWLERGYVVAAVNVRLATPIGQPRRVGPLDQARDVAAALAWLEARAGELGIADQGAIVVGYSSGAHTVALVGADPRYLEEVALKAGHVRATISLDVHSYDVPFALELMSGSVVQRNTPLIRHLFGSTETAQRAASPAAYLDTPVAPAMLVSVDRDPGTPGTHGYITSAAARRYAGLLMEHGHRASTLHAVGENHTSLAVGFGEADDEVTAAVAAFLDTLTGP